MLQLIYQIDVWEYCVATSPAPQMDMGWNWCVICAKEAVAAAGSPCDCGHLRDSNACVKIMLYPEMYQLKCHWLKPILAAS